MEKKARNLQDNKPAVKYVLMAIRPYFARLIREGKKTIELRRVAPDMNPGDILIIYESAPVSKVTSYATVGKIIRLAPVLLWEQVGSSAMLGKSDFETYFSGKATGNGIEILDVTELKEPRQLGILSGCSVPQNYRYLSESEFQQLCSN